MIACWSAVNEHAAALNRERLAHEATCRALAAEKEAHAATREERDVAETSLLLWCEHAERAEKQRDALKEAMGGLLRRDTIGCCCDEDEMRCQWHYATRQAVAALAATQAAAPPPSPFVDGGPAHSTEECECCAVVWRMRAAPQPDLLAVAERVRAECAIAATGAVRHTQQTTDEARSAVGAAVRAIDLAAILKDVKP